MKRLWIAGGIFVIITALCIATLFHQQRQTRILLIQIDDIVAAHDNGDNDLAYALATALEKDFDKRTWLFPCFMSHNDLIGCRESVVLLPAILQEDNPEEFRMEAARCRAQFERLLKVETPSLQNIL